MPDPGDGDAWRIAVLGAGSWGTALASLAARNGHDVVLYGRDATALAKMAESRENARYLPGFELPLGLRFSACLSTACADADLLLAAVPSANFGQLAHDVSAAKPNVERFAWATKGFEPGSGRFLHEVARDIFGPTTALCVVTGPSFAREVVAGLPTAVTVHANPPEFAQQVADILHRPTFRAYTGEDIIGAELGGAMKNVLAVAAGVADGMELGLNARAGMITRGLHEMMRLNAALGGRAETLMGLAGLGDLVLTCTGDLSRNRRLGLALGRGVSLADAVAEIGQAVESIEAADEIMRLAERHNVELPISSLVRAVLHGEVTPGDALRRLLSRDQKPEYPQIWFA